MLTGACTILIVSRSQQVQSSEISRQAAYTFILVRSCILGSANHMPFCLTVGDVREVEWKVGEASSSLHGENICP